MGQAGRTGDTRRRSVESISLALLCLAVVGVVLTAVNRYTDSDPMGSLLVADSLLDRHTVALDGYGTYVQRALADRVQVLDGHLTYLFPIGTSLIALPVVAVARVIGIDVASHDHQLQIGLAALAALLTVLLSYALGRKFLGHWPALLVSAAFWFGTAYASSGATALWSHDFGVVLTLLALLLLVSALRSRRLATVVWLGLALGLAVVVRPQLALLAVGTLVVLVALYRRAAWVLAVVLALAAAGFIGLNLATVGHPLPDYYLPQRLSGGDFWTAFAGNLLSPSRGLLVFTPFLMVLPLLAFRWRDVARPDRWLVGLGLLWPFVHLVSVSRFPHWWGGWSYGPRLLTDVIPGLFLATVILWPPKLTSTRARVSAALFAVLALCAVWINTVQGLYNPYTRFWNIEPSVDSAPSMLWDWSYPQFTASESGHEARLLAALPAPAPLQPAITYSVGAPELGLVGWSTGFTSPGISLKSFLGGPPAQLREEGRRWTEGNSSEVAFTADENLLASAKGQLRMSVDGLPGQHVEIALNGTPIHEGVLGSEKAIVSASFDTSILRQGINVLTLHLPDAVSVGEASDYRKIAVALKDVTLS